ncbi:MAG: hypothetical protein ABWY04_13895 [Arthrobacter sp.]
MSVVANERGKVTVEIHETGPYIEPHFSEIQHQWLRVLNRLADMLRRVRIRRESPRLAVVVIHGIGEQEPGRTMQSLVSSGILGSPDEESFVKPDRLSRSFELRQVTFHARGPGRPATDVFELYWAHLIRDTTVTQVVDWIRRLLFRRGVPRPLRPLWTGIWLAVACVSTVAVGQLLKVWEIPPWITVGGMIVALAAVAWRLFGKGVVVDVLGDAARYLSPRAANISHRQAIRAAGVELLQRIHNSGRYDRAVVLGHSLGSVIAYDILTYSWIGFHESHRSPSSPRFESLSALERGIKDGAGFETGQQLQQEAWRQSRRNSQPWLITDLITVGSPLTYAEFLMAHNSHEFRSAKDHRVLPTCPPRTEKQATSGQLRCTYSRGYKSFRSRNADSTFVFLDHGAPFGLTKWTNLYFKARAGGLVGDLVGGPLAPSLGSWIHDVALESPVRRFSHGWYWRPHKSGRHIDALRDALGLECRRELAELAHQIPAYVIAETELYDDGPQATP